MTPLWVHVCALACTHITQVTLWSRQVRNDRAAFTRGLAGLHKLEDIGLKLGWCTVLSIYVDHPCIHDVIVIVDALRL